MSFYRKPNFSVRHVKSKSRKCVMAKVLGLILLPFKMDSESEAVAVIN